MASSSTLTLDLPESLAEELSTEARQAGLPTEEYAKGLLADRRKAPSSMPRTGADLVAYWREVGVIGSRPDIESASDYAGELRHRAERRHRS